MQWYAAICSDMQWHHYNPRCPWWNNGTTWHSTKMLGNSWSYWNMDDVWIYISMRHSDILNILMNPSTIQHFSENIWISIIPARTHDIFNIWDVQRYAAICSDMQWYAAICRGIIAIPGILDKIMEQHDISLKSWEMHGAIGIWMMFGYILARDIQIFWVFLWTHQHFNISVKISGFLSSQPEHMTFSTFGTSSDMQRDAAICSDMSWHH